MKTSKLLLILYFSLCFIEVIAYFLGNKLFGGISKMVLIPVIFIYYLFETKKINWLTTGILLFCYIGEGVNVFKINIENIYSIITPFFIAYVLFLILGIQDVVSFKKRKLDVISLVIVIVFIVFLFYSIIALLTESNKELIIPFFIYGLVLAAAAIVSPYNIIMKNRCYDLYYLFTITCFVISDIFYVFNNYFFRIAIIQVFESAMQILAYYFLVKYILERDNYKQRKLAK
jgi:hypothetical protein